MENETSSSGFTPMSPKPSHTRARHDLRGFTLVELLIVVVILGILAGVVIPSFSNNASETAQTAFAHELRVYVDAAVLYELKEGEHVGDGSSGTPPSGFEPYIRVDDYVLPTPIGGVWDTEDSFSGVEASIGVHFNGVTPKPDDFMIGVDEIVDDGNLTTGSFQKFAGDRFYFVLEWS